MTVSSTGARRPLSLYPQAIGFSVQLGRNQIVQALGVSMVAMVGLSVVPWPLVAAWTVAVIATVGAEDALLRRIAENRVPARAARLWAPALRMLATLIYATAALVLMARGGAGQRLFAFALMSASMVHVLMRYYRSPAILVASVTPYIAIMGLIGVGMTRAALREGHILAALAPTFTVLMFAVQFWAARAQLADVWGELMNARQAAEQRERAADAANHAKSQFLTTMSHELRTPLNGVLGMAQALTNDTLTAVQRERVGIIRRSSESLLAVLNDLLDLSKIESSSVDLEAVEFDMERLVDGVVAAYEPIAMRKGLAFTCELGQAARGKYRGDSARIRRILYNLADNAVKFTEAGAVTLRIERGGDRMLFRVIDTGIGIGEEDLTHLFESFFQADATLARRYAGTGIGLAICGELAKLMGGQIEASSELGRGSTFTLTLPLERVATAESGSVEAEVDGEAPAASLRVLAAEDNLTNQLVLKALLGSVGITPTIAADGLRALEAWEGEAWDIILMDIQMPQMNGIDAALAIRRRELETGRARTPIVAVTANAMTHQVAEYEAAGMDGVVPKPVDLATLFSAMELALAGADAAEAEDVLRTA